MHTPGLRCDVRVSLSPGREVLVKLLKGVIVGGVLISTGQIFAQQVFAQQVLAQQAVAEADTSSEIRLLKAKLKQLEQRVEDQGRKEKQIEAQANAAMPPAYKASPSAFDPCPAGKVCYKGITLTFGGWVDLTGIYRTRNLASDTGSVYNFIPYPQAKNFTTPEARFSAPQAELSALPYAHPVPDP